MVSLSHTKVSLSTTWRSCKGMMKIREKRRILAQSPVRGVQCPQQNRRNERNLRVRRKQMEEI